MNTAQVTEYSSLPDTDPNAPFERDYPPVQDSDALDVVGGSIGNYVWLDENSDGYQDAGEPGIAQCDGETVRTAAGVWWRRP